MTPLTDLQHLEVAQDDAAVDIFAARMKAKLAAGRAKGRAGWTDDNSDVKHTIIKMLLDCMTKSNPGNFVDIAVLAMMLEIRQTPPLELSQAAADRDGDIRDSILNRVTTRIQHLEKDERLHYRAATVFANAPLAMIQSNLTSQLDVLYAILGEKRPTYPCDKE